MTKEDNKIKALDVYEFLNWLKEKDVKAYDEIMSKAYKMKIVLALTVLMAIWWMGEAIPLPVTALLPLVILPLFGADNIKNIAPHYAHRIIFLFMGGFIIAAAIIKWNLHKRLALLIVSAVGVSPKKIILGFILATAFLSMWISNTATALMMMPIGLAIILHIASMGAELQKKGELKGVDFRAGHFE
ncbi:SLC13 family permease [Peptococcaceae bacterium]|nr:SLC13 family permease [Peptococcaceae bacterium]